MLDYSVLQSYFALQGYFVFVLKDYVLVEMSDFFGPENSSLVGQEMFLAVKNSVVVSENLEIMEYYFYLENEIVTSFLMGLSLMVASHM